MTCKNCNSPLDSLHVCGVCRECWAQEARELEEEREVMGEEEEDES
jgi:hypothetical protein